jgi:hypothetical protein
VQKNSKQLLNLNFGMAKYRGKQNRLLKKSTIEITFFLQYLPSSRAGFYFFSTAKKSKQKMPPLT